MTGRIALILLLACLSPGAFAAVIEDLYRVEIEVRDRGERALQSAVREGLAEVLVRMSGSRGVLEREEVRAALADSRAYLQQYQYRREERGDLRLLARYDPQVLADLLRRARAPLWSANRSPLLVWLVVDNARGRRFANAGNAPELLDSLRAAFRERGVPAIFPLYDLDDRRNLSLHELWEGDYLAISRASLRYGVGDVLAGRLSGLSDDRWIADWWWLHGDDMTAVASSADSLAQVSAAGVDFAAESMAARYAVAVGAGAASRVFIQVDGVPGYAGYRQLVSLLEGIELVEAAWPARVDGDRVILALRAEAGAEQLDPIIALERRLRKQQLPLIQAPGDPVVSLAYRWMP